MAYKYKDKKDFFRVLKLAALQGDAEYVANFVFQDYYVNSNDFDGLITEKEREALTSLVAMDAGPEFELSKERIMALIDELEKNA